MATTSPTRTMTGDRCARERRAGFSGSTPAPPRVRFLGGAGVRTSAGVATLVAEGSWSDNGSIPIPPDVLCAALVVTVLACSSTIAVRADIVTLARHFAQTVRL